MNANIHMSTNMIVAATITTILIAVGTLCSHRMYVNMKHIWMIAWSLVLHLHLTFWLSYFIALFFSWDMRAVAPSIFSLKTRAHLFVVFPISYTPSCSLHISYDVTAPKLGSTFCTGTYLIDYIKWVAQNSKSPNALKHVLDPTFGQPLDRLVWQPLYTLLHFCHLL